MNYAPPRSMKPAQTHYCPGCGHGVAHRLICEVIDEMGIRERMLAVAPVGCAVMAYDYWDFDVTEAAHGRAPAVATGMKRCNPDMVVFSYQGDGDLAAIGAGEIVNAANRGELISVFFINNATYGMTGGQMAPTSLIGQKTTTSPGGRVTVRDGWPMRVVEMLAQLTGTAFATRCALDTPVHIRAARAAIRHAFDMQVAGRGFSIVEMLAACPVGWGVSPTTAVSLMGPKMTPVFPLGVLKDIGIKQQPVASQTPVRPAAVPGQPVESVVDVDDEPAETEHIIDLDDEPAETVAVIDLDAQPADEATQEEFDLDVEPEAASDDLPAPARTDIHINLLQKPSQATTTEDDHA